MFEQSTSTISPLIKTIDPGSPGPEDRNWLDEVGSGRVIVVKSALQKLVLFDKVRQLTLNAIEQAASRERAQEIESQGFENLHLSLDGQQIYSVYRSVTARLKGLHHHIVTRFIRDFASYQGQLYIGDKIWVRFFVPYDQYLENRELFSTRVGHLCTQNPHRDSWITNPSNSFVIWFAVSRVVPGNGMLFYPDYWGRSVDHPDYEQRQLRIDTRISLGVPKNVALDPGDALVFSGEHLHSSEVNVTGQTRYVLSFRFTMEAPRYGEGNRWYPYRNADWLDSALSPLASWRSRFNLTYLRYLLFWRLGYWLRQHLSLSRIEPNTNSPPPPLETPSVQETSLPDLQVGEIRPLDATHGIARTLDGTFVFPRFCPHEGADLTTGYLCDGRIHCPWHNLGIDLSSGTSPCQGLKRLQITRLVTS